MSVTLTGSVGHCLRTGRLGVNRPNDVTAVQRLLNASHARNRVPRQRVSEDGRIGPGTISAISHFQRSHFGWADGVVDPGQITLRYLNTVAEGGALATPSPSRGYHYDVPGQVPAMRQPTNLSCWATVGAMMLSWRRGRQFTLEQATQQAGARPGTVQPRTYFDLYAGDGTLPPGEHSAFAVALGLTVETPMSAGVDQWLERLQAHGPLAVNISAHAREFHMVIVTGMSGDGSPERTMVQLSDPATGQTRPQPFRDFARDFEQVEAQDRQEHRPQRGQLWYFP